MEIGLEKAGFPTSVCVEINPDCRETLKRNRPQWRLFDNNDNRAAGDIRAVDANELLLMAGISRGDAGLVTGGAPCQPFSNIGMKRGKEDPSNGDLFLEFVKIVRGVLPKAFIFENVAGIAQTKHNEVVDYMKKQFDGLGYGIAFKVINSADYGVPQTRKRFIMIGLMDKIPSFPLPTHSKDPFEWARFTKSLDKSPNYTPLPWKSVAEALDAITVIRLKRHDNVGMKHSPLMVRRMELIDQGENFKVLPMDMRPACWQSGKHQGHDTFGRIEASKPSPTIRTAGYNPTKGKYIHPYEHRGLNTAEMSALQDFPENWEFHTATGKPSIVSIGRQIGNAVPPGLSKAIGKALALQF
jgi:DNA (cytosine-5)-methyltransferase 1